MYCPEQTDVGFDLHFKINYNKNSMLTVWSSILKERTIYNKD